MERKCIVKGLMEVFQATGWVNMELAEKEESRFDSDLGFDSLDRIEICMDIERKFGIEISDDEVASINTVGDAINLLDNIINN